MPKLLQMYNIKKTINSPYPQRNTQVELGSKKFKISQHSTGLASFENRQIKSRLTITRIVWTVGWFLDTRNLFFWAFKNLQRFCLAKIYLKNQFYLKLWYYTHYKRYPFQIDLVDISQLSMWNDGVKYLFAFINTFTWKVWVKNL